MLPCLYREQNGCGCVRMLEIDCVPPFDWRRDFSLWDEMRDSTNGLRKFTPNPLTMGAGFGTINR